MCQPAGVDRQQQRVKKQHGREVSEIGICDEGQITGERHPTQCGHGTHAECRKHERGGDKTDSVDDRQVPHPAFLSVALDSARCTRRAHTLRRIAPVSLPTPSDLGTAALGLARQLSRTGAARLTDVCITAERGSVSHACVPLGNRKTFQKSDACSLATIHLGCEETSGNLEPLASIERQNLMQVRLGSLCADNAQQGGARP